MRKILLLFIPLLVCVFSLNAQKLQTPPASTASKKIDPQLLSPQRQGEVSLRNESANSLKALGKSTAVQAKQPAGTAKTGFAAKTDNKSVDAQAKVPVEIKCIVTPTLLNTITSQGGEIVSSSAETNLILAKLPATALEKIAASNDVKSISKVSSGTTTAIRKLPFSEAKTIAPEVVRKKANTNPEY